MLRMVYAFKPSHIHISISHNHFAGRQHFSEYACLHRAVEFTQDRRTNYNNIYVELLHRPFACMSACTFHTWVAPGGSVGWEVWTYLDIHTQHSIHFTQFYLFYSIFSVHLDIFVFCHDTRRG